MMTYLKGVVNLPKVLTQLEKTVLLGLLLVIVGTSGFWWRNATSHWSIQPVQGGIYSEGIVDTSPQEIDLLIAKLTKIGLTYTDHKQKIHGALAQRWEIAEDGKKYTFYLRPTVDARKIAEIYATLPEWQNINISPGEDNTVTMTLKQPFSPLLSFTGEPVVDEGPYRVEKQSKTEIVFAANKNFVLGEPNIHRLVLTFYPDEKALKAAIQRQEVMGADRPLHNISGTTIRELQLTKQVVLLFNLDRPTFKDKEVRKRIRDGQKLDKPIEAVLATTQEPDLLAKANAFAEKAKPKGLNVSIKSMNPIVLERDVLRTDEYDLLLTSINYGYDEDPYPFWHSSQLIEPGKNYAGYNSKEADKLIEQARQTLDWSARQKQYQAFQSILADDIPAIFYPAPEFRYTISRRIKGTTEGVAAVPSDRFSEVWRWYIKAKKQRD